MPVTALSLSNVAYADAYFATKLHSEAWSPLSSDQKQQAKNDATRIINKFGYLGIKTVSTQAFEWPRNGIYLNGKLLPNDVIPDDILIAENEIAYALALGIDPERELRSARITSRGFSSVRVTYDSKTIPQHLMQGVPSALAWDYLYPYLSKDEAGIIKIHRV